jgi:uncharacterized protein YbbC (DUF1343 family)
MLLLLYIYMNLWDMLKSRKNKANNQVLLDNKHEMRKNEWEIVKTENKYEVWKIVLLYVEEKNEFEDPAKE